MNDIFNSLDRHLNKNNEGENIVIEAFGIPGSGKSYICGKLLSSNKSQSIKTFYHSIDNYSNSLFIRVIFKSFLIFSNHVLKNSIAQRAIQLVNGFKEMSVFNRLKLIFNMLLITAVIIRNQRNKRNLILDQGILQAIWSCFYYAGKSSYSDEEIDEIAYKTNLLIKELSISNLLLLHIKAEKNDIYFRLRNREVSGTTPLNNLEHSSLKKGFVAESLTEDLIKKLCESDNQIITYEFVN